VGVALATGADGVTRDEVSDVPSIWSKGSLVTVAADNEADCVEPAAVVRARKLEDAKTISMTVRMEGHSDEDGSADIVGLDLAEE
jgi:hypothetical protein